MAASRPRSASRGKGTGRPSGAVPIMHVSVCIPTTRPATLAAAIASIRRQSWTDWELLVVGPDDDPSLRAVTRAAAGGDERVRFLEASHQGVSHKRNLALAAAAGEVVALTDDDCEAQPDWLATIAGCFAEHPDVGVVGGALRAQRPSLRRLTTCLAIEPAEVLYDPVATPPPAPEGFGWYSANVALRRSVVDRVGPFDEHLGPPTPFLSAEDLDYGLRLEAAGVKQLSTPRSVVDHTHGCRRGARAVVRYWHGQDAGGGAIAAKLTLQGDPRGRQWLRDVVREQTVGWLRDPKPHRLVSYPIRLRAFLLSYHRCVRRFRVDERGLLAPRH